MIDPTHETWVPVSGYLDHYEVSDLGHVRSLTHRDRLGRLRKGRILKPGHVPFGYPFVNLSVDGKRWQVMVHKLVAREFLGPMPAGMETRHLDGNVLNSAASNLAYGTRAENRLDSVHHGTHQMTRKTHCPQGHPYDEANTHLARGPYGRNHRLCRTCLRLRQQQRQARQKELRRVVA